MADDIDDLLRRAMKTLDEQVPSGYFDALPSRTLGRLEDVRMQTPGTTGSDRDRDAASTGIPPMTKDREEDSGLHDIRSLASSTKARLSSRRSTQNPVVSDDDILASSSAGWKAVALPEPAKMVSLPELAELPSANEVKEAEQAPKKAKAEKQQAKAAAVAAPAVAKETPASSSIPSIGSRIAAKQQSGGKGKVIAVVGLGLAAAAGVTFFVMTNNKKDAAGTSADKQVAAGVPAAEYKSTAKMLPPPPPPSVEPIDTGAAAGSAAAAAPPAQIAAAEEPAKAAPATKEKAGKPTHKVEIKDDSMTKRAETEKKADKTPKEEVKKTEGGDGEPSFDALLKEAGVSDMKKEAKPKLDKKSLSGGDIKAGMGSVAGKAQACFAGTQGTAQVKLTVTPDGKVSKVSVSGVFAGTPVASCVESAVKSAQFPAWEGGPQSFGYSYLLSE